LYFGQSPAEARFLALWVHLSLLQPAITMLQSCCKYLHDPRYNCLHSATELQQMESTYNPEQAEALIGNVSASTIRNWCKLYSPLLSKSSNPDPKVERRLTQTDVATLQQVKVMRDNRRTVEEIIAALQQSAIARALTIDTPVTSAPSPQDASESTSLVTIALSSMERRQDATDKRIDVLQQALATMGQHQGERRDALMTGIVIGGAIMLIAVALALGLMR
jgi:DNA-binding transcriptional MerR regulator